MKAYNIIWLEQQNTLLILICTCESPFTYLPEIKYELDKIGFSGTIIFDELLHSGNNEERFISCTFEGGNFQNDSFKFTLVPKQAALRKYMSLYLKNDSEYLHSSGLTSSQIKLIEKECVI